MATTGAGTPYVESSDLVANYPAVSEALAERVDLVGVLPFADSTARGTALPSPTDGQYSYLQDTNATEYWDGSAWVAAGVAPGLVHINTTTFSAVSSVSVDDVFTSAYDNYLIVLETLASGENVINMRMRASGSDASGGSTYKRYLAAGSTSGTLATASYTNSSTVFALTSAATNSSTSVQVYQPFLEVRTKATYISAWDNSSGNAGIGFGSGAHTLASAYDGFTLFIDSGNFTGTLRIYGYKNGA